MTKASAGTPQIKNSNGRLQIVLSQGGKRSYLSLGVPDNKQNRVYAQMVASRIWNDILAGHFTSLKKYERTTAIDSPETKPVEILTLAQLWEHYTDYKRSQLSQTTIAKDFDRVRRNINKLPVETLAQAVAVRDYLVKNTTPNTAKRVLTNLGAACNWAVKSNLIIANPFAGMSADITVGKGDPVDINPFTPEERNLIIQKFRDVGSHYAPLVEFLFRTGSRPSEAIALQAKHLGKDYKSITFCQSVTASESGLKLKQGLKTQKQRVFPCGDGLQVFLESLTTNTNPEHFLFGPANPRSKFINIDKFSYREWHKVLNSLGIADRGIYQCRHTYITFCLDSGMDAKDVAKLVGNSPEMIYRHYAGAKRDLIAPDI
jgi:integrase